MRSCADGGNEDASDSPSNDGAPKTQRQQPASAVGRWMAPGMRHELRLRRSTDIQRVRASRTSWAHPLLVWIMRPRGDQAPSRFAIVVGKRVGKAVCRNRVRRRVREAVRGLAKDLKPGYDVVLIARPPTATTTFSSIALAVASLAARSGVGPGAGSSSRLTSKPSVTSRDTEESSA